MPITLQQNGRTTEEGNALRVQVVNERVLCEALPEFNDDSDNVLRVLRTVLDTNDSVIFLFFVRWGVKL